MKQPFLKHYYNSSKLIHSGRLEGIELAGFTRRLFALLIDVLVLIIVLYLIGILLDGLGLISFGLSIGITSDDSNRILPDISNNAHINVPEYLKIIIKLLIPVLFFGLITYFTNGYTLGKRMLGIRIVSTSHMHLTLWHSIERSLGYYASSLEFGFGFIQYFTDYNRRTVHDRIAETIVVRVNKIPKRNKTTDTEKLVS